MKQKTNVPVLIMTLILCLAMAIGCFTTACSPKAAAETTDSAERILLPEAVSELKGAALLQKADADSIVVQSADGRQYVFRAADRGVSAYSVRRPDGTEAGYIAAAANAAYDAVSVFGETVPEGTINVWYFAIADGSAYYTVRFGGEDEDDAEAVIQAMADAATGEVCSISRNLAGEFSQQEWNALAQDFRWEDYDLERDVIPTVYETAKRLVEAMYPGIAVIERSTDAFDMERSYVDGIQIGVAGEEANLFCDVYLRMSDGPCYYVQVCYPSLAIAGFERYRIGWEGCKRRSFNEAALEAESVEQVDAEASEEELALLVQTAKAYVGKEYPVQESEFGGGQLNYSLYFLFKCVFQPVFGDVGYGTLPVLGFSENKTPTDAVPGHELVFIGASGASDDLLSTLYVGGGKCVYADLSTKKIVEASVEELMRLYPNGCRENAPTFDRTANVSQSAAPTPEPEPIPAG